MNEEPQKTTVFVWIRRPKNKLDHWFTAEGLVNIDDNEVAILVNEDYLPELIQVKLGEDDDREEGKENLHQGKPKGHKDASDAPKSDGPKKRGKRPNKRRRAADRR